MNSVKATVKGSHPSATSYEEVNKASNVPALEGSVISLIESVDSLTIHRNILDRLDNLIYKLQPSIDGKVQSIPAALCDIPSGIVGDIRSAKNTIADFSDALITRVLFLEDLI